MTFAGNEFHADLTATGSVAFFEQAGVQFIGHHDIGVAMHDEHRHLVREQALQIVHGVEITEPGGEIGLRHGKVSQRLCLRILQRPAGEIAHRIDAHPGLYFVRMSERPSERHHASAALPQQDRFGGMAMFDHLFIKERELRRAGR